MTDAFAGVGKPTVVIFDWGIGQALEGDEAGSEFPRDGMGLQFHPTGEFLLAVGGGNSGAA